MKQLRFVVETFDIKTKQAAPERISVTFAGEGFPDEDEGFAIMYLRDALSELLHGARVVTLHEYEVENSGPQTSGLVEMGAASAPQ